MESKKYKFFDTIIEIITPEKIEDVEPYRSFLSDGIPDFAVVFEYVEKLPEFVGEVSSNDDIAFSVNGEKSICWYSMPDTDEYYACRIFDGENLRVQLLEKFQGKLWNGILFNLLGYEELIARKNGVVLHASMILKNGKTILFTAPCGTGKSTQADLWGKYADAQIINGDKALVSLKDDVIFAGGLPFAGSSKICKNISAPLMAIVCLGQAKENTIRKLSEREAFVSLLQGNYRSGLTKDSAQKTIDVIEKVCNTIPVYKLDCLPDKTAVECLERELKI
jgi:hypothetical protein